MMWLVHFWWWVQYVTGISNTSGRPYGAFSGFFSNWVPTPKDIVAFAIIYRKLNCHEPKCPRIGHHPYKHSQYCKKHHPKMGGK